LVMPDCVASAFIKPELSLSKDTRELHVERQPTQEFASASRLAMTANRLTLPAAKITLGRPRQCQVPVMVAGWSETTNLPPSQATPDGLTRHGVAAVVTPKTAASRRRTAPVRIPCVKRTRSILKNESDKHG
jgi:hypothetical protein